MDSDDYLIPTVGLDTDALLAPWEWLLPSQCRPTLLTKFGDWFLVADGGEALFLDLLEGEVQPIDGKLVNPFNATFTERFNQQLSVDWIEVCKSQGKALEPNQCYGWAVHPILGGALSSDNIKVFSLSVYQTVTGQLFQQRRQYPEGFKPTGFVVDRQDQRES